MPHETDMLIRAREAITSALRTWDSTERLIELLGEIDAGGDRATARAVLGHRPAGYRLLGVLDPVGRLKAGLILAADREPRLARRGRADVTRIARIETDRWLARAGRHPRLAATPQQVTELRELVSANLEGPLAELVADALDRQAERAISSA